MSAQPHPPQGMRSRAEEYAQATRRALLDSARRGFARRGFAGTSIEDIVQGARVTRGALYHHFASKQEIYEATLEELLERQAQEIATAVAGASDPWAQALAGIDAFLETCSDHVYARVVVDEAAVALDWDRRREIDERHGMGLVRAMLQQLSDDGWIDRVPLDMLAHVVFAALVECALRIARAPEPRQAKEDARRVLLRILEGLRAK